MVALVTSSQVLHDIYASLIDVPDREQAQLGASDVSGNPPHIRNIERMSVSPLVGVKHFRPYSAWAATNGHLGRIAYDKTSEQHLLLTRGNRGKVADVPRLMNANMPPLADLDYLGSDVTGIAPEMSWLDELAREIPIFGLDDTPVVLVNLPHMLGFIQWLNEALLVERQAERLPAGGWFMLPHGDILEYLARGLNGTNEYGGRDGRPPDFTKRLYRSIAWALQNDEGVDWGEGKVIKNLCGVLWQRAGNRAPNTLNAEIHGGSWLNLELPLLRVTSRISMDPFIGDINFSFRLVLPAPSTPDTNTFSP